MLSCSRLPRLLVPPALLLVLLGAGCALPPWVHGQPRFPAGETSWELPLYEPLTQIGPHVAGTFYGAAAPGASPPREDVVLYVDSGSSHSSLPEATFRRLGVDTVTSRFATIEDAAGVTRSWSGALVPEARIGGRLAHREVVASVDEDTAILGADVLDAHGWQIDLDRGTMLLGPAPWPAGPDVVAAPTHTWGAHAIVDVAVQGAPVPLLLDTGALVTVVARDVLRGLGLPEHPLYRPFPIGASPGGASLASTVDAAVAIGGHELGQRSIAVLASPAAPSTRGMLGYDILSGYAFQVTRAGLRLRPRTAPLVETVGARVARWHDLPSCPDLPGCVAAAPVVPGDPAARIHVRVAAAFPGATRFLFGCVGDGGRLASPFWLEIAVRRPAAGAELDVAPREVAPPRQLWAARCTRLALLDVNPVIDAARPMTAKVDVEARLKLETRNMRLR